MQATQKEELVHALFGVYLINQIKKENPDWFNDDFYDKVVRACKKAYESECAIIDWIFEEGELDFLPKDVLKEFIKQRLNDSLELIGINPIFELDQNLLARLKWFNEEIYAEINIDFFHKKSTAYSKSMQAIKAEDLF